MAVPKRRTSKSAQRIRRANHRLATVSLSKCPNCEQLKKPHQICPHCGQLHGQQITAETTS